MYINEEFKSRVLIAAKGTATIGSGYLAPTPGVCAITVRVIANIVNAADLALTLNSADDAIGTNPVAFKVVPAFVNGIRVTPDSNIVTITQDSGNAIVDFEVMPGQVPEGKTIGIAFGISDITNIISAQLVEDVAYVPSDN